jgi:hypothetical protein
MDDEYAVLDAARTFANEQLDREVIEDLGTVTPYAENLDQWCSMPVRLVWNEAGGLQVEAGPYTLCARTVTTS